MKVKCPGCGNFVEVDRSNIFCRVCGEIAYPDLVVQKELSGVKSRSDKDSVSSNKPADPNHKSKRWEGEVQINRKKEESHTKGIVAAVCVVVVLCIAFFLFL